MSETSGLGQPALTIVGLVWSHGLQWVGNCAQMSHSRNFSERLVINLFILGGDGILVCPCHIKTVGKTNLVMVAVQGAPQELVSW